MSAAAVFQKHAMTEDDLLKIMKFLKYFFPGYDDAHFDIKRFGQAVVSVPRGASNGSASTAAEDYFGWDPKDIMKHNDRKNEMTKAIASAEQVEQAAQALAPAAAPAAE
jgi:hypothetical protein